MPWDWLKSKLRKSRPPSDTPGVHWLEAGGNPWGVPVLDLRPFALGMISTSKDPRQAENAMSFGGDDGAAFIGVPPHAERRVPAHLRYAVEAALVDGALFLPTQMEHKWAIFLRQEKIIFVRSWTREVVAVASLALSEDGHQVEITGITGALMMPGEDSEFTVRAADFLLRTHALGLEFPAPLPAELAEDPNVAAQWCFSLFGNLAVFAACDRVDAPPPPRPLRTYSLLHIAVARGETYHVDAALSRGFPANLRDRDGLTPLHWAVTQADTRIMELLLARGAHVDALSDEGATALMNAAQDGGVAHVVCLLAHGADPRAADARGFTALHRAAEKGRLEIARILVEHGAVPDAAAEGGHTPLSLAEGRKEQAVVEMLRGSGRA